MPEASRYEIQPVDADDTWDRFVAKATGGNLFVRAPWLQCAQLAGGASRSFVAPTTKETSLLPSSV